jgi:hypothetical protein
MVITVHGLADPILLLTVVTLLIASSARFQYFDK